MTRQKTSTVVTTVRLPTDLHHRYRQLAEQTGRPFSWYIQQAIIEAIDGLEVTYHQHKLPT